MPSPPIPSAEISLLPAFLEEVTLRNLLAETAAHFAYQAKDKKVEIRLDVPEFTGPGRAPGRPPAAIEATAYFVACEALTNAVKHARARRATVTLRVGPDELVMEIADDGVGGADPAGHGLANIMDRAAAVNGEAIIDSPPGQGTRLQLRIPCA